MRLVFACLAAEVTEMCTEARSLALCASRGPGGPALASPWRACWSLQLPAEISLSLLALLPTPGSSSDTFSLACLLYLWLGTTAALTEGNGCSPVL